VGPYKGVCISSVDIGSHLVANCQGKTGSIDAGPVLTTSFDRRVRYFPDGFRTSILPPSLCLQPFFVFLMA